MNPNLVFTRMVRRSTGPSLVATIGLGVLLMGIAAAFTAPPLLFAYRTLTVAEYIVLAMGWGSLFAAPLITTLYAALMTARDAGSEAYVMLMMSSPIKRDIVRAYHSASFARARLVYVLPFALAPNVIAVMVHARQSGFYLASTAPELADGVVLLGIMVLIMAIFLGAAVGTAAGLRLRDPLWSGIAAVGIMIVVLLLLPLVVALIFVPLLPALLILGVAITFITQGAGLGLIVFVVLWMLAIILWRMAGWAIGRTLRYAEEWV